MIQFYLLIAENGSLNFEIAECYLTHSKWFAGFVGHQDKSSCLDQWKCCIYSSHSNRYCSWSFMTSNSCKTCVKKVQSRCFATRASLTDTGSCSQEVLLLFLVLGLLFRISSSWSLSQSLWNNQYVWVKKQPWNHLCCDRWWQFSGYKDYFIGFSFKKQGPELPAAPQNTSVNM